MNFYKVPAQPKVLKPSIHPKSSKNQSGPP